MSYVVAIILGIVQGLTEFLPVSSSGHLAMFGYFFGLGEASLTTAVILHIATFFSVCVVYKKQIASLLKNPFCPLGKNLLIATFVSAIMVIVLKNPVEKLFSTISYLPYFFLITALVLLFCDLINKKLNKNIKINTKNSIFVGFVQGLAVFPGISRSGSTISALLVCGVEREDATNFSFLLSLPIIFCSGIYEFIKLIKTPPQSFSVMPNFVAFVVAFIIGIFAIKIMQKFVNKAKMWWFSIYLTLLAIVLFLC